MYEFLEDDFIELDGYKLYRIRATQDIDNSFRKVLKNETGGYGAKNLILKDNSWIFHNAKVINVSLVGNSYIIGDYIFRGLRLIDSSIHASGNYNSPKGITHIIGLNIVGHNFLQASQHAIVWGILKNTNVMRVCVGCNSGTVYSFKCKVPNVSTSKLELSLFDEYKSYLPIIEKRIVETILGETE